MARFRSQPTRERSDLDSGDRHPGRVHSIDVHDPGPVWRPIGLLDAEGKPIERYCGLNPIGFLWDREPPE